VADVDLDDISGMELCQLLRGRYATQRVPIVLFTSRPSAMLLSDPRLRHADGLFCLSELRDLARRVDGLIADNGSTLTVETFTSYEGRLLQAHFDRIQIVVDGLSIDLAPRELKLLQFLIRYRNRVLTREDILTSVWNGGCDPKSRTVDTHVRRLRMKLRAAGRQIQTVRGVGYRFSEGLVGSSGIQPRVAVAGALYGETVQTFGNRNGPRTRERRPRKGRA
jgi:DNA-binding response OmpR family regulator